MGGGSGPGARQRSHHRASLCSLFLMDDLNLSQVSAFLDFDGTVTVADTGVHLLNRLAR